MIDGANADAYLRWRRKGETIFMVVYNGAERGGLETLIANFKHIDLELVERLLASDDPKLREHGAAHVAWMRDNATKALGFLDPIIATGEMDEETTALAREIWDKLVAISAAKPFQELGGLYSSMRLDFSDLVHVLNPQFSIATLEAL